MRARINTFFFGGLFCLLAALSSCNSPTKQTKAIVLLSGMKSSSLFSTQKAIIAFQANDSVYTIPFELGNYERPISEGDKLLIEYQPENALKDLKVLGVIRSDNYQRAVEYSWAENFAHSQCLFINGIFVVANHNPNGELTNMDFFNYQQSSDSLVILRPLFSPTDSAGVFFGKLGADFLIEGSSGYIYNKRN
ncbi:hypothetical protein [Owenweeksia hongkongensis]|uniref:hypothetical protein n=1 Tax=Owenweeksia hongkongensis TaxID=253245 RepID=UPI003A94E155